MQQLAKALGITTSPPSQPVEGMMYLDVEENHIRIWSEGRWRWLENAGTTAEYIAMQQIEVLLEFEARTPRFEQIAEEL